MAGKELSLCDVWRTCNKIRACLFHTGLKMWQYFLPKDPYRSGLVSVQQFHTIMKAELGEQLNLSDYEVNQLALFFSTSDGRILYQQFCSVLHGEEASRLGEIPYVTGLEFEEPMHTNALTAREERRVHVILVKIAATINARRLVLRPFFQDYELIAKNVGCVTIAHFSRLLNFLGITIASEEFGLLLKKFLKDSYTVNYVAFVTAIDNIITQLDRQNALDTAGDVVPQFPGRVLSAELPKLPRPELVRVCYPNYIHHPALTTPTPDDDLERVIRRIQAYVSEEGVRVSGNFIDMDDLRTGRVSKDQFRRGLDYIGIGGFHRLFLTDNEIETLTDAYRDPNDESRVCWEAFVDDIDRVFTTHGLEKYPTLEVRSPLPPRTCPPMPERCAAVVMCVARYLRLRRCALRPGFFAFDDLRQGHVTTEQVAKALDTVSLKLPGADFAAIVDYFTDTKGFNYYHFLSMVEPSDAISLYQPYEEKLEMVNREPPPRKPKPQETNIVEILAKIKRKVVRDRVRVIEFLRKFDKQNRDCISNEDFHRGIDNLQIGLSPPEVATLIDVFASPLNPGMVDYRRMAEVAEEAMSQQGLERAPLIVPVQTVAIDDGDQNFLNFEERQAVTNILIRLAHKVDCDLQQKFKDWDAPNIGSISREQFIKVLCIVGLASLFSGQEIDTLVKCFGVERGLRLELNYRALCNSITTLQSIYKRQVF